MWYGATFSSPLISTDMCKRIAPDTADLSVRFSRLYQTSISPDNVRTSIIVCPRKSSDSRVNFCRNFDLRSLSSSQTRTFIRSDELWHSLNNFWFWIFDFVGESEIGHIKLCGTFDGRTEKWMNHSHNKKRNRLHVDDDTFHKQRRSMNEWNHTRMRGKKRKENERKKKKWKMARMVND